MTICMVTNMYPSDETPEFGAFVKSQIDSIAAAGHEVSLILIDGRRSGWNYVSATKKLREVLGQKNHDVVHAHYGLSGLVACFQHRCPVVVSFCGDDLLGSSNGKGGITHKSRLIVWIDQLVALMVGGIIVKSREMMGSLRFSSARKKAVVIPNGVDFELFQPQDGDEPRESLELYADKRYVLFPSTPYEPRKRLDLAEQAIALLREHHANVELLTLNHVPQAMMPRYMNASDAMVLTSDWEGSPNVIKEAMACNLPIVSVDAGDAWDIIDGARHCYKAERNPRDLADKLSRVLSAGERSDGRARIEHLELGAVANNVLNVYHSVVEKS